MANDNLQLVIGKRQILRELKKNNIAEIMIASDAEQQYIYSLIDAATEYDVKYSISGTMESYAAQYNVDVPTGAIGILK